jgi:hypothetical protein
MGENHYVEKMHSAGFFLSLASLQAKTVLLVMAREVDEALIKRR